ncbi:TonB-dependent receptor [Dysgonomonas sp. 216]|uniref:outer membrane beta-barrel protein n=1 Tax=Dysgonomonas sp. 216 TaxID=2302934 RepID=UPI0013D2C4CD|nr:outer membrane beta-barrel protein [Dysgonomonas sp. 216]NDW18427.1 TonB-dependent receptor [Dysgonomonas sp. 216]
MRFLIISFFLLGFSLTVFGQGGSIQGEVRDSLKNEVIGFALIRILNKADSAYVKGSTASENGIFNLKQINNGSYTVEISLLGYSPRFYDILVTDKKKNHNLGIVYLNTDSKILDEAIVTAEIPNIVVKGDTIEYNADAYLDDENDLLEDLIKNIPGIELDENGNLSANGKAITKILVDGKEFFGNDIKMALKNLPANMVKKLQLFKEESEKEKASGVKDEENREQVINLEIKEEYKKSLFGDVRTGYGTEDRYANKLMANMLSGDNQISLVGNLKNIPDPDGYGMSMGLMGEDREQNIGVNLSHEKKDKFSIDGDFRYEDNKSTFKSDDYSELFLPDGNRINSSSSKSVDRGKSMRGSVNFSWKPDTLTRIYFRTSGSYNSKNNNNTSNSKSFVEGKDTTYNQSNRYTKTDGSYLNFSLMVGRKLGHSRRNVSLNVDGNFRGNKSNGFNKYETSYSSDIDGIIEDLRTAGKTASSNWGLSLSYSEPIGEKNLVAVEYSYRRNSNENDNNNFKKDDSGNYSIIDSTYTRNTDNLTENQSVRLRFQGNSGEKLHYNIVLSGVQSYSRNTITRPDRDKNEDLRQNRFNWTSGGYLSYRRSKDTYLDFSYQNGTSRPSLRELSTDTIVYNAQSMSYGNPNLKTAFNNRFNFNYRKSHFEKERFFNLSASFSTVSNKVVSKTKIDSLYNSETTYVNENGDWNTNVFMSYNTPLKNKKFKLDVGASAYFARRISYSNEARVRTNNLNISEWANLSFSAKKVESRLQLNHSYNMTRNNLENQENRDVSTYKLGNYTSVELPFDIKVSNNIGYSYNSGYSSDIKKTELMWNMSASKKVLRNRKGTIKIDCFDILNDRNNITRHVHDSGITDMRTNYISRFVLFSFIYRFNFSFSGGSSSGDDMMNDYYYY